MIKKLDPISTYLTAGDFADKINELIDAFNELETHTHNVAINEDKSIITGKPIDG